MYEDIRRRIVRADDLLKAAPGRRDPGAAYAQAERLLTDARAGLEGRAGVPSGGPAGDERRQLVVQIARRMADIDRAVLLDQPVPPGIAPAPTRVDDPGRVPPGQHLTAGWPVLHTGSVPTGSRDTWRLTVTGLAGQRRSWALTELHELGPVTVIADMHCVTGWTRLDNTWTGVAVRDLLEAADVRPGATSAVVSGHPAYSANLPLDVLTADDCLFAWAHDGKALDVTHGGPLRLVVPQRYAWKSVKWAFELRVLDRDVPGYWEERGYHNDADPWREQRFRGD